MPIRQLTGKVEDTVLLLLLLLLKQTRVGSPEATASLLRSPQGGEWIIAVVNQKTYGDAWGEF